MRTVVGLVLAAAILLGVAAAAMAQGSPPAGSPQAPEETPREDITLPLIAIAGVVVLFVVIAAVIRFWPRPA